MHTQTDNKNPIDLNEIIFHIWTRQHPIRMLHILIL